MQTYLKSKRGFTLIELLTVIAIIAILAGLLFPAIRTALQKAENSKASTAVTGVATAFRAYYTEYGKWPTNIAAALNVTTNLFANPRNIIFYDFPSKDLDGSGNYLDTWKQPFQVVFDHDYDNGILNPLTSSGTITAGVLVWSKGADSSQTNKYITSW